MKTVEIYTTPICGYCQRAKRLLSSKGIAFVEIDVMAEPARRAEMVERSGGGRTVPQIWINDTHVGGFTDLLALDREGRLQTLLKGVDG